MRTGWLVDTFGHISQAPQIHRLFGIDAVYVWRRAADDAILPLAGRRRQQLLAVDLFGGYRNLYGVSPRRKWPSPASMPSLTSCDPTTHG